MKTLFTTILGILLACCVSAQSAEDYFVDAAHLYVNSKSSEALDMVQKGLQAFPNQPKLEALKQKIEEEQNNQKGDGEDQEPNSQDGNQQEQEKTPNQQKSDQQDGQNLGQEGTGNSDEQARQQSGGEQDEGNPNNGKKLQEQRYNQILKALKNQEQNTQRRLMMGDSKSKLGRKQKDW